MNETAPLVTILTPVYNGELYLRDCINSVISQTYANWEYYIINNCSTDSSLEIANGYARRNSRIHVVDNPEFVGVIENHNIAFKWLSPESKFCKVVSADDWLYPECIESLVRTAESNESISIVGSYQLSGGGAAWAVKWCGLPHSTTVVHGRDICRATLLGGPYVFGCPTSVLYRSDLARGVDAFYPNLTPQADVSAFYHYLQRGDFGFVHQVLSYERIHDESVGSQCKKLATQLPSVLSDLLDYGPIYLTESELQDSLNRILGDYHELVVDGLFHFESRQFWDYHKGRLKELGYSLYDLRVAKLVILKLLTLLFNPLLTIQKVYNRLALASRCI